VQVCTEIWRFAAIVVSRWDEGIFHAESEPEHYRFGVGGQSFAKCSERGASRVNDDLMRARV
jgi:hypothetical protein